MRNYEEILINDNLIISKLLIKVNMSQYKPASINLVFVD